MRRLYDALNHHDWDGAFADAHRDIEVTTQRGPEAGTKRGREAAQGLVEDYIGMFDEVVFEPEEFVEVGDQVLVVLTRRARAKGADADMAVRNGHLFTFRDGRILSMRSFPDPEEGRKVVARDA